MSATSVLSPTEFQARLERYLFERSEEWRAVRVGEKEVSEQAEIVRRYADLFTREQLDAPHAPGSDGTLRERWLAKLLGDEREAIPTSYHTAWMRRLSTLEATYTKERATEICLQTLEALGFDLDAQPNIRLDLDDRPQKSPRA